MVEVKNNSEFVTGDKVWWTEGNSTKWGIIYEIREIPGKPLFACIHENGNIGSVTGTRLSECWRTKEECEEAESRRAETQRVAYKESIRTLEDLVVFMFEHQTNGIGRDRDAEAAARERAKEMGIRIS